MKKRTLCTKSISLFFLAVMLLITGLSSITDKGEKATTHPAHGQLTLEFDEERAIIDSDSSANAMLSYIRDFKLDSRGRFYLLDGKHPGIMLFDSQGVFLRQVGEIGKGPGYFLRPSRLYIDPREITYVYDSGNHNVTGLSPDWKVTLFVRIIRSLSSDIFVTPNGDIYAFSRDVDQTGPVRRLAAFNKKGVRVKTIAEFKDSSYLVKRNRAGGGVLGGMIHTYSPDAYLYPLDNVSFIYGHNLENTFHIYNTAEGKGKGILLVDKKVPIKSKEQEYLEKKYGKWAMLPAHRPFFKRLLSDEKGRIYVILTRPVLSEEESTKMDVFTREGNYIYRLTSPVVPSLIGDGYVYSLAKDDSGDAIITRYRIKNYASMKY